MRNTRQLLGQARAFCVISANKRNVSSKRGPLDRIPNADDLTNDEMVSLRLIVERSFASRSVLPNARRARLVALGLIQNGMGGVMATPAGRMVARK